MANRELHQTSFGTIWDGLGCFRLLNVPLLFPRHEQMSPGFCSFEAAIAFLAAAVPPTLRRAMTAVSVKIVQRFPNVTSRADLTLNSVASLDCHTLPRPVYPPLTCQSTRGGQ
jgi:hypothetical protein